MNSKKQNNTELQQRAHRSLSTLTCHLSGYPNMPFFKKKKKNGNFKVEALNMFFFKNRN
jgi:hypothetical protein